MPKVKQTYLYMGNIPNFSFKVLRCQINWKVGNRGLLVLVLLFLPVAISGRFEHFCVNLQCGTPPPKSIFSWLQTISRTFICKKTVKKIVPFLSLHFGHWSPGLVSTDKNDHLYDNDSLQAALVKMTSRVVCNKNLSLGRLIVQSRFCAISPNCTELFRAISHYCTKRVLCNKASHYETI